MSREYDQYQDDELEAMDPDALAELDAQAADEREAERAAMAAAWDPEGEWPTSEEIEEFERNLKLQRRVM